MQIRLEDAAGLSDRLKVTHGTIALREAFERCCQTEAQNQEISRLRVGHKKQLWQLCCACSISYLLSPLLRSLTMRDDSVNCAASGGMCIEDYHCCSSKCFFSMYTSNNYKTSFCVNRSVKYPSIFPFIRSSIIYRSL